ncbi:sigma factor-like helix-turn-helix DNA-binding protein [Nautilia sp.]
MKQKYDLIIEEAKKCWEKYGTYDKMIECLEKKNYKNASSMLKGLTLDEIGYILGVTRERVRQLHEQAVKKIKKGIIVRRDLKDFL